MRTAACHIRADEAAQIVKAVQPTNRLLAGVIGAIAIFALLMWSQGDSRFLMVAVVMILAGAILTFAAQWHMRRAIAQWIDRHANCPAYMEWDEIGFGTGGCVHGEEGSWPWSAVSTVIESPDFLIPKMGRSMQIVPKRAFIGDGRADLHARIAGVNGPPSPLGGEGRGEG